MRITTSKLQQISGEIQCCLGKNMYQYVSKMRGGYPCKCSLTKSKYLTWVSIVISYWEQNNNGSTTGKTNYISDELFSNMIAQAQKVCDCGC